MVHFSAYTALVAALVSTVICRPSPTEVERRAATTCIFTNAASAIASKTACSNIVIDAIKVPAGTTLDLTGLKTGTTVTFQGNTSFGYKQWDGPLISVSGTNIKVVGGSGSVLDGLGSYYWDGEGSNGGKTKPKFFYAHNLKYSSITNVKIANSPVQVFSVDSSTDLSLVGITIDNSAGAKLGHNTDAFDVGESTGIYISGANVINQDDCLAINSGTNITFTGGTCNGGHGLSIGSVGGRSDNTVSQVVIENSSIINSQNGVRIKTISGATGSVSGIKYKNITLSGISKYGVVIEQDYENGSPTGTPTTGVPITNLTLSSVTGSVAASATDVYILCGKGSCSGWTWAGVSIAGGKKSTGCENVPSGASCQ